MYRDTLEHYKLRAFVRKLTSNLWTGSAVGKRRENKSASEASWA